MSIERILILTNTFETCIQTLYDLKDRSVFTILRMMDTEYGDYHVMSQLLQNASPAQEIELNYIIASLWAYTCNKAEAHVLETARNCGRELEAILALEGKKHLN